MSKASSQAVLKSGIMDLTPETVETLPEKPALYRLLASSQRVMYIGHAGEEGLRNAIRKAVQGQLAAGIVLLEYEPKPTSEAAELAAREEIRALKPLYNEGFGRYRNSDFSLPKKGHRIRKAMQNP